MQQNLFKGTTSSLGVHRESDSVERTGAVRMGKEGRGPTTSGPY